MKNRVAKYATAVGLSSALGSTAALAGPLKDRIAAGETVRLGFAAKPPFAYSFLEKPQLVTGDKTILEPGMVLAVDGSVTVAKSFRAQVGDSFIVTEDGYEQITQHPKDLDQVIL